MTEGRGGSEEAQIRVTSFINDPFGQDMAPLLCGLMLQHLLHGLGGWRIESHLHLGLSQIFFIIFHGLSTSF